MKVIQGNNIELLKQYPDNYFDAIVTDPPYGLGKEPNAEELMKDWIEKGYHEISGSGFMGKEWDAFVPQPIFWKEVFRVLKHGGHVLSFFGTRTYDWGVMAMRFAGFEVRDCIQWLYGCLSDDTEILTKSGYIQYHKFIKLDNFEEQEICIYDIENDIYKWEKPERWNEYNINQDTCYRIKSDFTDQIVSRNHRCLIERNGSLLFEYAEILSQQGEANMPILESIFNLPHPRNVKKHKSYSTTLATITPFEYSGVIFCPTVSTGCFVARRNGNIFITGNSGFPKSHNISKAIDKMYGAEREIIGEKITGNAKKNNSKTGEFADGLHGGQQLVSITKSSTEEAKQWDGWGSALKPANEPIVLARKPLEKGLSIAENVLKWGTGAINIDGCRICTNENLNGGAYSGGERSDGEWKENSGFKNDKLEVFNQPQGRFPANILLTHHPECECKGLKKVKAISGGKGENSMGGMGKNGIYGEYALDKLGANAGGLGDENGEETIEDWACHDDCPIKLLDEQSGESRSTDAIRKNNRPMANAFGKYNPDETKGYSDKGGASRFFYVAKASKSERNKGLEGFEYELIDNIPNHKLQEIKRLLNL